MTPSALLCVAAAIIVLAPKSKSHYLLAWLGKYTDETGRDALDTSSRLLHYFILVGGVELLKWITS